MQPTRTQWLYAALPCQPHRLIGRRVRRGNRWADEQLVLIPRRDVVAWLQTTQVQRIGGRRARAATRVACDRDALVSTHFPSLWPTPDGVIESVPVGPWVLERLAGLNTLPRDVEVENEASEIALI